MICLGVVFVMIFVLELVELLKSELGHMAIGNYKRGRKCVYVYIYTFIKCWPLLIGI